MPTIILIAEPGVYTTTGSDVKFSGSGIFYADPGSYVITGDDVALRRVPVHVPVRIAEERDKHIRRGPSDYAYSLMSLLPFGQAWDAARAPGSITERILAGLAYYWGHVDSRAADLLERESDPRITLELLTDWERNWGLPDPCLAEPLTIADRQIALVTKMTLIGGQSRQFFIELGKILGYEITYIKEFSPWTFGLSECGMTDDGEGRHDPRWEIGPPEIRFYWTYKVGQVRWTWWRYGSAELGVDPHCRISLATDTECILHRYKPAHTDVIFDYSEIIETRTAA